MAKDQDFGGNFTDLFGNVIPDGSSSKTSQCFDVEDWDKCYDPSQRSGTMQNGIVYLLEPLVRLTRETGSGSWPTPTARDYKDTAKNWEDLAKYAHKKRLPCSVAAVEKRNGKLNPRWVDWLMGYPIDHTDCDS